MVKRVVAGSRNYADYEEARKNTQTKNDLKSKDILPVGSYMVSVQDQSAIKIW